MRNIISKKIVCVLVVVVVGIGIFSFATAKIAETLSVGPLLRSVATKQWNYDGYSVKRFLSSDVQRDALVQLEGTEAIRDNGVLAFSSLEDARLYVLREGSDAVEITAFTLPQTWTCYGCSTSSGLNLYPMAYMVGESIVGQMDGKWYLYNPETSLATLWFDPIQAGMEERSDWTAFSVNDQLYVYSPEERSADNVDDVLYWISTPNVAEKLWQLPSGVDMAMGKYARITHSYAHPISEYVAVTDTFANGALVGQIDDGIYVQRGASLTRLGYARYTLDAYVGLLSYMPHAPLQFGEKSVAWIGTDNALYVAEVNFVKLQTTGVQDVPSYTPFRTASNATVYVDPENPDGIKKYMTASAYIRDYNDPTFSRVIVIPDSAVDTYDHLENANPIY